MQHEFLRQAALDAMGIPIFVLDRELRIVVVNKAFQNACRDIGIELDLAGLTYHKAFPFLEPGTEDRYKRLFESGESDISHHALLLADRTINLEVMRFPVTDGTRVTHIVVVGRDVTDEKRLEQSLRDSEATARTLLNASPDSVVLITVDGEVLRLNAIAASRINRSVEEAVGLRAEQLLSPEEWAREMKFIRQVVATRNPEKFETIRFGRKVECSMSPILDADGNVSRIAIYDRDVTERELAVEALRNSEETARALINASSESMLLLDVDGTIITLNETAASRLGGTIEALVGHRVKDLIPAEVWDGRAAGIRRVVVGRQPIRFQDSRNNRLLDANAYPVYDGNGEVVRIAVFARDITQQEAMVQALRESEERYRNQFESMPVPTFVWETIDNDFVLRGFNRAALDLTEGHVPGFVGLKASGMYADRPDIVDDMRTCSASGQPVKREMVYFLRVSKKEKYVLAHYVFVPPRQLVVHVIDLSDRKEAEAALQEAQRTLEQQVAKRTEELAQANELLKVEREALDQKNIALQEVIEQASRSRNSLGEQIQANVDRIVLPILDRLASHVDDTGSHHLELARSSLREVAAPFVRALETKSQNLTPREIELCNFIRAGKSTKEIAAIRNTSLQTVLTQRKIIRRKLGILGKDVNLVSYLRSMLAEENPSQSA